jgi:SAM-dependent MidA family methyltransferase
MTDDLPPLEADIRRRIALAGPMPVAQFMALCLTHPKHGYYITRDPFGSAGDFVTAPEITQMFGELLGLWAASVWRLMGSPENIRLVELGPGRGTMMLDALRAVQVVPAFRKAIVVHFVEVSPALEARQRQAVDGLDVPVEWHQSLDEVPHGPLIVLANEFFDALPVHQAVMCADGWHERVIKVEHDGNLGFATARDPIPLFDQLLPPSLAEAAIGSIFEWRVDKWGHALSRRVRRSEGAALIVDYGHAQSAVGDTLQAVGSHDFVHPLSAPGLVDLTAHVDFQALAQSAEAMDAAVFGPLTQGDFLRRLGIESRTAALKAAAPRDKTGEIEAALHRLTSSDAGGMGGLFKALAMAHPKFGVLPGFEK